MAKKVKVRKLKITRLIVLLLIVVLLFVGCELYLNTRIENIIIKGNNYLKDDYILKRADIMNYPSFYFTPSFSIKNKLKKDPYIKDVKVKKSFYHVLKIEIDEARPLFYNTLEKKVVFENEKTKATEEYNFRIPRLLNKIEDNKRYKKFINRMNRIDDDILGKISEIEYVPNDYDKDRFLLSMDDGNSVYLTLTKFTMIDYYDEVIPQLEGKRGILYLDSGNHFQIME